MLYLDLCTEMKVINLQILFRRLCYCRRSLQFDVFDIQEVLCVTFVEIFVEWVERLNERTHCETLQFTTAGVSLAVEHSTAMENRFTGNGSHRQLFLNMLCMRSLRHMPVQLHIACV